MKKYYIGMDLGGTNIKATLYTYNFECVIEKRIPTMAEKGSTIVLQRMLDVILELLKESNVTADEVCCMGIGVPGLLNIETGISIFSPNFVDWENIAVVEWFEKKLGISTYIDNDVRMNLYGEWFYGAGKNKKNIVLITLGTGLGSGIIVDGHVLYGTTGSVGEIGHMNMYRNGRLCKCGSSGCLGRYVSALGMLRTAKEKLDSDAKSLLLQWTNGDLEKMTAKMISDAFDLGDKVAQETMYETGEILGFGLVNVINLFNPEIIIIGGGMSAAGERILKRTREIVDERALQVASQACEIVVAYLGDTAGMRGAAIYASKKHQTDL